VAALATAAGGLSVLGLRQMHETRTIAIADSVAWASVSESVRLSRGQLFLLIRRRAPLRYCHYYVAEAILLPFLPFLVEP